MHVNIVSLLTYLLTTILLRDGRVGEGRGGQGMDRSGGGEGRGGEVKNWTHWSPKPSYAAVYIFYEPQPIENVGFAVMLAAMGYVFRLRPLSLKLFRVSLFTLICEISTSGYDFEPGSVVFVKKK